MARRGRVPLPLEDQVFLQHLFLESGTMRHGWALCDPHEAHQRPGPLATWQPRVWPRPSSAGAVTAEVRSRRLRDNSHDVDVAESGPES